MSFGVKDVLLPLAELGVGVVAGVAGEAVADMALKGLNVAPDGHLGGRAAIRGLAAAASLYVAGNYVLNRIDAPATGLIFFAVAFVLAQPKMIKDVSDSAQVVNKVVFGVNGDHSGLSTFI